MTKSKKGRKRRAPHSRSGRARARNRQTGGFEWIPLWGWILIFLVPLAISEYMFYAAGREISMILFPIAWIGFWVTVMQRAGWPILDPILKKRGKNNKD